MNEHLIPEISPFSNDHLLKNGKRIRPILCSLFAEGLSLTTSEITPCLKAVEWVHNATLAHDDVIDEAQTRRDQPTLRMIAGSAKAVLTGDLLLARAMVELSKLGDLYLVQRMSEVLDALVTAEWMQLNSRGTFDLDESTLDRIALLKTASLLEWTIEAPFSLKFGSTYDQNKKIQVRSFARALGLAYQFKDDILDYSKDSKKDLFKDIQEGQLNQVTLVMIRNQPELKTLLKSYYQNPDSIDLTQILNTSIRNEAIQEVQAKTQNSIKIAEASLSNLKQDLTPEIYLQLNSILNTLLERKH